MAVESGADIPRQAREASIVHVSGESGASTSRSSRRLNGASHARIAAPPGARTSDERAQAARHVLKSKIRRSRYPATLQNSTARCWSERNT